MTRTDWVGDFVGVKPGVAYVTVRTYNGKESSCKVTVKEAPASVKLNKGVMTLKVGQTGSLSAIVPDGSGCATRTFRTSNSSVVKMTKTNWTGERHSLCDRSYIQRQGSKLQGNSSQIRISAVRFIQTEETDTFCFPGLFLVRQK